MPKCQIFFFDDAPNVQIERQAIGRVRRLRQTRWVRVIRRFLVKDSFFTTYECDVTHQKPAWAHDRVERRSVFFF